VADRRLLLGGLALLLAACTSSAVPGPDPVTTPTSSTVPSSTAATPSAAFSTSPRPSRTPVPSYAAHGPGTWTYARGHSKVFGAGGPVRHYRVAVEDGIPVTVAEFAAIVDSTLGDRRSWTAGGDLRLQRVAGSTSSGFTVLLATPGTTQDLCAQAGLDIFWRGEPYTSCYTGGRSVINLNRWFKGIPKYGAPLEVYRQYAINHEVGHALGHGHELCPAKGEPAPVMQQQTFDLQGCAANAWPYLDGKRYAGPPGRIVPPD
jgi:hypothetical protein